MPTSNITVTKITPANPQHTLFGRVLTVIKADAEWVYAELKDGVNYVEAKFAVHEVQPILPAAAPAPIPAATAPAPVETAPPAVPTASTPATPENP